MAHIPWKLILVSLLVTGCGQYCSKRHEDMNAEEVLESYLQIAFNMEKVEQKKLLLDLTTGSLKAAIAGATEETIKAAYIERRYDLKRYYIVERIERTPREVEIIFQLEYLELPEGSNDDNLSTAISVENTVSMIKEKKRWYVRDVLGSQTSMEFPLLPMSEITPLKK